MKLLFICIFSLSTAASSWAQSNNFSVEMRATPIADAIRLIAHLENNNVILPDKLAGTVTASFANTSLSSALDAILASQDLGVVRSNGILRVSTRATMEAQGDDLRTENITLKYAKAKVLQPQASQLASKRGAVFFDERTNSVTVHDTFQGIESVRQYILTVDIADQQVLIEARVVQANTSFARNLGIQWGINSSANGVSIGGLRSLGAAESTRPFMASMMAATAPTAAGFAFGVDRLLDFQLSMAETRGEATVLSRPSIVTTNNEVARIHSGTTFNVQPPGGLNIGVGAAAGANPAVGAAALQQIVSGITLLVTPHISPDNKISMSIDVTQSEPDYNRAVGGIPAILDNNAKTNVVVHNGETTVIGGLFQSNRDNQKKGIPWLQDIPILGALFKSIAKTNNEKELLIFITPTIVSKNSPKLDGFKKIDTQTGEFLNKEAPVENNAPASVEAG